MSTTEYKPPIFGAVHTMPSGKVEMWPIHYKERLLYWHRKGWEDHAAASAQELQYPTIDPSMLPKEE